MQIIIFFAWSGFDVFIIQLIQAATDLVPAA